ncbi:hypothetical protein [Endozoicomonas sp. ALC066]|uniref:hypothetical protein n=1 Tax=Endozoicomonas sp. ALC066 TaxID=3403078 RepID=UPI003BB4AB51
MTTKLYGVCAISTETGLAGNRLLNAKADFKRAMTDYRKLFGSNNIKNIAVTSSELRDGLFGGLKIQDINFVQCYRQPKLLIRTPKKIGFTWASASHGVVSLTVSGAVEHLQSKYLHSQAIIDDIEALHMMRKSEKVAVKRTLSPHLRANIFWPDDVKEELQTDQTLKSQFMGMLNTPLPIFIIMQEPGLLPEIKHPRSVSKKPVVRKADSKLKSIRDSEHCRVFCYR